MDAPSFRYPFFPVQFTKDGEVFQQAEVDTLIKALTGASRPTDLWVLAHGWNNNMDEAKALYSKLAAQLSTQISQAQGGRTFAIFGVLWPSKKFEDDELIPSGAASLNDSVTEARLRNRIAALKQLCNGVPGVDQPDARAEANLAEVERRVDAWEDSSDTRREVVALIREIIPSGSVDSEDASDRFLNLKPDLLINLLSRKLNPPPNAPGGVNASALDPFSAGPVSGLGGAAGFRDVLGGIKGAFLHLLNYTTYQVMKDRADKVGLNGVNPVIKELRGARPDIRVHMIGHSFGCRLLSSAVNQQAVVSSPNTLTLLQGTLSHNGFASQFKDKMDGAFRQIVAQKKVRGPILISHTRNDKAVGLAYPIASRIAGQAASALGDENDLYGGLGSNGAQNAQTTPERVVGALANVGADYPFKSGATSSKLYNLRADRFISGHSDIVKPEVAYAIAVGIATPDAG